MILVIQFQQILNYLPNPPQTPSPLHSNTNIIFYDELIISPLSSVGLRLVVDITTMAYSQKNEFALSIYIYKTVRSIHKDILYSYVSFA